MTTNVVSLNNVHGEVYLIRHYVKKMSVNCDGSVVSINKQTNLKVSHKNKLYKWLNFFEPLANKGLCRVRFDKTHRKSTRIIDMLFILSLNFRLDQNIIGHARVYYMHKVFLVSQGRKVCHSSWFMTKYGKCRTLGRKKPLLTYGGSYQTEPGIALYWPVARKNLIICIVGHESWWMTNFSTLWNKEYLMHVVHSSMTNDILV
jgi:hypothetical protein